MRLQCYILINAVLLSSTYRKTLSSLDILWKLVICFFNFITTLRTLLGLSLSIPINCLPIRDPWRQCQAWSCSESLLACSRLHSQEFLSLPPLLPVAGSERLLPGRSHSQYSQVHKNLVSESKVTQ